MSVRERKNEVQIMGEHPELSLEFVWSPCMMAACVLFVSLEVLL